MANSTLGLTLVELLIVVLIISFLVSMAGPSFFPMVRKIHQRSDVELFQAQLNLARHTAITKGVPVTFCPRHASRKNQCGKRNMWHQGTLAFEDINRNRKLDGQDAVLLSSPPLPRTRIAWRAFRNRSYLQFNPTGITDWQNGHFLFCPLEPDATLNRQLVLNYAGRTYASQDSNGDGVHEDVRGKPLNCG